ncbi:MAG: GGDEF domain-containing protein [Candidatus Latescibacteria bacterium]|nr:GGDEF domain-containing protein [Candidatus Latescibacterota bacterium]
MALSEDTTQLKQGVQELEAEGQQLRQEMERLRLMNQRWAQLAGTDSLTGLPNKISCLRALAPQDIQHARTRGEAIGFILLSGDNLGPINENKGRDAGDQVLRGLAEFLRSILKGEERLGHLDGSHYAVVLYPAGLEEVRSRAEELRLQIGVHPFPCAESEETITASLGITSVDSSAISEPRSAAEKIFQSLNGALYRAKKAAGNRIEIAVVDVSL